MFAARRGFNFYSALGFVSVLLTGGIGLLKLPVEWLAIKEAAVPFIIGIAVLVSLRTRYPLIKTIIHQVIAVERVYAALRQRGRVQAYERRLVVATYMVAFGLLVSTVLNYAPGTVVVVSAPGSTAFNEELGRMTALSFPVITVPLDHHSRHRALLPRQWHHQGDGPRPPGRLRAFAHGQLSLTTRQIYLCASEGIASARARSARS